MRRPNEQVKLLAELGEADVVGRDFPRFVYQTNYTSNYELGKKSYELKDHLGNVRALVSDKRDYLPSDAKSEGKEWIEPGRYFPVVQQRMDYYPFGLQRMKDSIVLRDTCNPWVPFSPGTCGLAQRNDWQPGSNCCMSMEVGDVLQVTFNDENVYRFSFNVNVPNGVQLAFRNKGTGALYYAAQTDGNHSFLATMNTTLQIYTEPINPNQGATGITQFCNFRVETYNPGNCEPCSAEPLLDIVANDLNDDLPDGWTFENNTGNEQDMFGDCNGGRTIYLEQGTNNSFNFTTTGFKPGKKYRLKLTNCDAQDASIYIRIFGDVHDTTIVTTPQTISNIQFTALDTVHEFHIGLVEGANYFLSQTQLTWSYLPTQSTHNPGA